MPSSVHLAGWRAACKRHASGLRAVGERLASGWRAAGERLASGLRVAGKWLASDWRAAGERLASGLQAACEWLASGWRAVGERLASGWRAAGALARAGTKLTRNVVATVFSHARFFQIVAIFETKRAGTPGGTAAFTSARSSKERRFRPVQNAVFGRCRHGVYRLRKRRTLTSDSVFTAGADMAFTVYENGVHRPRIRYLP